MGRRDIGLLPALGGLLGTMIDTGGPYIARVKRVLTAGVFGGAAGLAVGELIHGRGWIAVAALVVVAGVSAVAAGRHGIGHRAAAAGLQLTGAWPVRRPAAVVAHSTRVRGRRRLGATAHRAGLVALPRSAEQRSVAAVYHALAGCLRAIGTPRAIEARRAGTAALNTAYDTLLTARSTAGGRGRRMTHLMAVLNASHPLSEEVTALRREGTQPPLLVGDTIDRLADAIATGAALQRGPRLGRTLLDSLHRDSLHRDGLRRDGQQGDGQRGRQLRSVPPIPPPWSASPGSLALRDAMAGLARAIAWTPDALPEPAAQTSLRDRIRGVLGSTLDRLRGGWLGQTFAIRLMICIGAAAATSEVLPLQRSYWVVLTVAIVLKPDYGSVFARALQRGIGTIVGAVLGAVILAVVPYGPLLLIPLAVLAAALPFGRSRNFGLMATFLTPLVVVLIDLPTPTGWRLAGERLIDTLLGCVIMLLIGYTPWPMSWHSHLPRQFAATLRDTCRYTEEALVTSWVPAAGPPAGGPDGPRAADGAPRATGPRPAGRAQAADVPGPARRSLLRRKASRALADMRAEYQRAMSEPRAVSRYASAWWPGVVGLEEVTAVLDAVADAIDADIPPPRAGELPADEALKPVIHAARPVLELLAPGPQPAEPGAAVS